MPPPQTTSEYVVIYLITQLLLTAHVTCVKRVKLTADVSTIININITTYNTYNPAPNYYHCNNYIITNKKREAMKSKIVPPPSFFFFFLQFFLPFFFYTHQDVLLPGMQVKSRSQEVQTRIASWNNLDHVTLSNDKVSQTVQANCPFKTQGSHFRFLQKTDFGYEPFNELDLVLISNRCTNPLQSGNVWMTFPIIHEFHGAVSSTISMISLTTKLRLMPVHF